MKFIDLVTINVKGGKGGDGIIAFRRELYVPKGGPSGGDGGNGGNVIFVGDEGVNTLFDLRKFNIIKAEAGTNGMPKNMTGARGANTYIKVPLGTIIRNSNNAQLIGDITEHQQELIVAAGGIGGRGNARFASATNRVPKVSENGSLGQELKITCELKLLANVGLIGLPNAGKSTFLSKITNAQAEVGEYPFTTLVPQLGVVNVNSQTFTIADLPGLIAGASFGKGLGLQFLKHIERCQVLVHLIDSTSDNLFESYQILRNELKQFNEQILNKPEIIVLSKLDLDPNQKAISNFKKHLNKEVHEISAFNQQSLSALVYLINDTVQKHKSANHNEEQTIKEHTLYQYQPEVKEDVSIKIHQVKSNEWNITGPLLAKISQKNPLNSHQNRLLFELQLQELGVFDELRKKNIKFGDKVVIYHYEMIWK